MTFPSTMFVNGRDVAAFKVLMGRPKGFMGPSPATDHRITIPGRAGQLRVSNEGEIPPRAVTVAGVLRAASQAEFDALWAAFTLLLADDEIEIRFPQWPDRIGYARYEAMEPGETPHQSGQAFTLRFTMDDPHKYALDFDVYTIPSGTEVPLLLGTAPSDVRLRLVGTVAGDSNPTVFYKDAQGAVRGDVAFAMALPFAEWIDWNWDGHQLAVHSKQVDGLSVLTDVAPSGDRLFVADPADGDATQGPSLLATNCNVTAEVRRAWR